VLSGSGTLTLNPGTYVLKGGIVLSGSTAITGTGGVTLYFPNGGISMSGTGAINLTAPSSGPYNGILIWRPAGNSSPAALSGGSSETLNGIVYVPGAALTYSGGSNTTAPNTTIVCSSLTMSGNSYIDNPAGNPYTGGLSGVFLVQ
jgi:hypothetical protein